MAVVAACWLATQRGSTEQQLVRQVVAYHQKRNRAARLSRHKQENQPTPRARKKRRPPRPKRKTRSSASSK